MEGQQEAWDSFYSSNGRAWRGVSDISGHPFSPGSHILEIGCGNGKTAMALRDEGMRVTAMDFSQSAIDSCVATDGMDYICASVTDMPYPDGTFDGALAFHVLEHLDKDEMKVAVNEILRVLKPGSYLMVRVFSRDDMRSMKGTRLDDSTVMRGNGIVYHYFSEEELKDSLVPFVPVDVHTVTERTRFGTERSRISAIFRKV